MALGLGCGGLSSGAFGLRLEFEVLEFISMVPVLGLRVLGECLWDSFVRGCYRSVIVIEKAYIKLHGRHVGI